MGGEDNQGRVDGAAFGKAWESQGGMSKALPNSRDDKQRHTDPDREKTLRQWTGECREDNGSCSDDNKP